MKQPLIAATLMLAIATPALAQQKAGNCAVYAEMAADTIKRDSRTKGPERSSAVKSLKKYASAQQKIADSDLKASYEQSKAFGYSKAQVDEMTIAGIKALRAGFHTSTMDEDKIYSDHVVALNTCAQGAKSESELGQSPAEIMATLEQMLVWARS